LTRKLVWLLEVMLSALLAQLATSPADCSVVLFEKAVLRAAAREVPERFAPAERAPVVPRTVSAPLAAKCEMVWPAPLLSLVMTIWLESFMVTVACTSVGVMLATKV